MRACACVLPNSVIYVQTHTCISYTPFVYSGHQIKHSLQAPVVKQESDGDLTVSINDISSQEEDGVLADTMNEGIDNESSQSGMSKLCYV